MSLCVVFSMASVWLEEYKKTKVAKKRGLRKELYRKTNPPIQKHTQTQREAQVEGEEEEEYDIVEEDEEMENEHD